MFNSGASTAAGLIAAGALAFLAALAFLFRGNVHF